MPLPLAHGLVGASVVAAICPQPMARRYFALLLIGALLANCPDLDFFLVVALRSRSWHRGFSHSFALAVVISSLFFVFSGNRYIKEAIACSLAFASHGVLDYITTKEGGGVELLWPFNSERLALGWFGLSELPSRLPAREILKALVLEFAIFTPTLLAVLLVRKIIANRVRLVVDGM